MICDICGVTANASATVEPFQPVIFERDGVETEGRVCAACHADLIAFNDDPSEIARSIGLPARLSADGGDSQTPPKSSAES